MGTRISRLLASALLIASACTSSQSSPNSTLSEPTLAPGPTSATLIGDEFDRFVEDAFLDLLARDPETATAYGLADQLGIGGELTDWSADYSEVTLGMVRSTMERLRTFETSTLSPEQQLTRSVFEWHLEQEAEQHGYRLHDWPVHFLVTSYNEGLFGLFTETHPLTNRNQIEDYLDRLTQVDLQVEQVISHLETAVESGIIPPRHVIDITVNLLRGQASSAQSHPIHNSFRERIEGLGLNRATVSDYTVRAQEALESSFLPAWADLAGYLESLRDRATDQISVNRLPDGGGFYRHLLRFHTSTDLGPEEIHELGLAEASRITDEMRDLGRGAGHETPRVGELRSIFAAEAGFVDSADVVATYAGIIDDAETQFAPFFSRVPSSPLEVVNDPAPVAFYIGPPLDGSRPGSFHAGTGGGRVPRYTMESLAHHEAVPGHHFQIALAQERAELPLIQRLVATTGHVEGWALYAERLAYDIGLYEDDLTSDFGRLDFELLRAARLVVDTGIHHFGWSRDEAIDEMEAVMGGPEYNGEVDRYAVYPGQGTAYLVGMLRILELREEFEVDLGDPAALALFHDSIIGHGNVPLSVLEDSYSEG